MPPVHGSYAKPCRVVMARKVRTSMGRTNVGQSMAQSVTSLEQQKRKRNERQVDADGELPVAIGHDPTVLKNVIVHKQVPLSNHEDAGLQDARSEARNFRRKLRRSYASLVGGARPKSAEGLQDLLAGDCGILVPDDLADELSSMVLQHHRPAENAAEQVLFGQAYGRLQLALEQKEKLLLKSLRQQVYDAEEGRDLEAGQQLLPIEDICSAMSEFGIAEDTMLRAVEHAFHRNCGGHGKMTFGELRSAIASLKDPSSPCSKASWRIELGKSFEEIVGGSGSCDLGLSRDQKTMYSSFLDRLMPVLQEQVDFMHPTAAFIRRRKSGTGKRAAPPKSKSAEPGIFGGPEFRMPTIIESSSAPVMSLADLKDLQQLDKVGSGRDSVKAILRGLPAPKSKSPTRLVSRPGTQSSCASSCWSEFRERKLPFRAAPETMKDLLKADAKMFREDERWKTIQHLEVDDPGSGLAGEKEKIKAQEDRFFQKMANFQHLRGNVDGKARLDLDKRDQRYQNKLNNIAGLRGSEQAKVEHARNLKVGLGNIMIPSGVLDNQPKFHAAQIYEGPAMEAKRFQARERERVKLEREAEAQKKEDDRKTLQVRREAERLQIIHDKQAVDREKEEARDKFVADREQKKLEKDERRKAADGWSVDHALKGLKADVAADCELIPDGFTQATLKEERRLNGIIRQDARYEKAVAGLKVINDKKRSRLTRLLWGEDPDLDLPGRVLEYVSPPKRDKELVERKGQSEQKKLDEGGRQCDDAANISRKRGGDAETEKRRRTPSSRAGTPGMYGGWRGYRHIEKERNFDRPRSQNQGLYGHDNQGIGKNVSREQTATRSSSQMDVRQSEGRTIGWRERRGEI